MTKRAIIEFFRRPSKLTVLAAGFVFLLSVFAGISWHFLPLELSEMQLRYEFWRDGIQEVQIQDTHGYLRDSCHPKGGGPCHCVALIHGLGDNAFTWKKILQWPEENWKKMGLVEPIKLFAPNLPGSGKSPLHSDSSRYQVRKLAEQMEKSMKTLCPDWIVVGNSFGGWVATWVALDYPEEVTRLVLLGSAGLKRGREQASLLEKPTVESMKDFQKKAYFKPREIPERVWKEIVVRAQNSPVSEIKKAQVPDQDLDLRFASLRQPVLMLWGQNDQVIPLSIGQEMRSLHPSTIWREVPECGHLPQKECPLPVIQAIIDMITFGAA